MERYVSEVDGLGFEVKENGKGNNSPFPEGIVNVTKLVVLHGQKTRVGGRDCRKTATHRDYSH